MINGNVSGKKIVFEFIPTEKIQNYSNITSDYRKTDVNGYHLSGKVRGLIGNYLQQKTVYIIFPGSSFTKLGISLF